MNLAYKYLETSEFSSYEDFSKNLKIKVPENFNFAYDIVDEYAKLEPDKKALVWCDDHGNEKIFSFGELKVFSDKTANLLKNNGIKKGDKVMLFLRRRYEFYFVALALAKIGAAYIPSSCQLTEKDIIYRNNAAHIKMIISCNQPDLVEQIEGSKAKSPSVEKFILVGGNKEGWLDFDAGLDEASDNWTRPTGKDNTYNNDTMIIYFTSGTTSMPKMTAHDFTYPLGHIVTAKYWQRVQDGGLHLTVADSGWAKFGWGKIYGQWICGAVQFVYDMDKFEPNTLLGKIEKYQLSTFCAPPTIYRFILQQDMSRHDLSSLVHCSTAGEPLNPEVYNKFLRETGLKILNGFGQTETTVLVANFEWTDIHPGAMGKPNPAYYIDVVDENDCSCEAGVEGELVIRNVDSNKPVGLFTEYYNDKVVTEKVWYNDIYHTGDVVYRDEHGFLWFVGRNVDSNKPVGLFTEYYNDKVVTEKVWYNDIYHTGDVVYRDEHGFLWFVGRNDDVIKASGYRISPFEVESALIEHPAVVECAVTGSPDSVRGIVVKATIVLAKGFEPSEELKKNIQAHMKKITAPYKYPRIIEFVDELPKTIGGKIKRAQIRHEDNEKYSEAQK